MRREVSGFESGGLLCFRVRGLLAIHMGFTIVSGLRFRVLSIGIYSARPLLASLSVPNLVQEVDGSGVWVQRLRGGLVLKAHRLLYHSTLGLRVIKKNKNILGRCPNLEVEAEIEFFLDNLLARVHFTIEMIRWTGLAP